MLDNESTKLMKHWRDTQDSCLRGVEAALLGAYNGDNDESSKTIPPNTPSDSNNANNNNKRKSPASSERKKACYKCRNKKVKCDGKQSFCLFKEEYYNAAISNTSNSEGGIMGGDTTDYYSPPHKKSKLSSSAVNDPDVLAKHSSSSTTSATATTKPLPKLDMKRPPTAAELRSVLQQRHPHYTQQRQSITHMYHQLQQNSREKITTAHQLKSMIDMALGRLNRDREKFERDLGLVPSNNAAAAGGGRGVTAVGAVETNAVSLNQSGMMMGGDTAAATSAAISAATITLAAAAEPHSTTTLPMLPNSNKDLAAIQTTPNSPDWILAKIISYNKYTKMYTLSDEDTSSNEIYTIPERQVRPLQQKNNNKHKWNKGDDIYAVYPDTTSFYPAVVTTCVMNGHVMVQFKDDWDASGVIHEKAVPIQHVMKAP